MVSNFSLADSLHENKLFAIILPMRSKEGEPHTPKVYFYTGHGEHAPGTWHFVTEELAKRFSKLDFNDWRTRREIWLYGPGKGMSSIAIERAFAVDRIDLPAEIIKKLPAGSYITYEGKVVPNPRETTIYDILEPELPFSLRLTFFRALLKKWLFLSAV